MIRKEKAYQPSTILGIPVDITVTYTRQELSCNGVT
jgi:hypothetical protein